MKKIAWFVIALMLVSGVAFGMASNQGSQPGSCDAKAWSCNAWYSCYSMVPANQFAKYPQGSPEQAIALRSYNQCAKTYVEGCMYPCDAKKAFPNLY